MAHQLLFANNMLLEKAMLISLNAFFDYFVL